MGVLVKKLINQTSSSVALAGSVVTTVMLFTNPGAKRTLFFEARCIAYESGGSSGTVNGATISGGASGSTTAMFFLSGSTGSPVTTVSAIGDDSSALSWAAVILGNDLAVRVTNSSPATVYSASVVLTGMLVGNT